MRRICQGVMDLCTWPGDEKRGSKAPAPRRKVDRKPSSAHDTTKTSAMRLIRRHKRQLNGGKWQIEARGGQEAMMTKQGENGTDGTKTEQNEVDIKKSVNINGLMYFDLSDKDKKSEIV